MSAAKISVRLIISRSKVKPEHPVRTTVYILQKPKAFKQTWYVNVHSSTHRCTSAHLRSQQEEQTMMTVFLIAGLINQTHPIQS